MAEFMGCNGSDDKCEAALTESRWPAGFVCPAYGARSQQFVSARGRLYFQGTACRPPVQRHQRHDLWSEQGWAVAVVPGHAPAEPVQDHRRGTQTDAPPIGLLQDRLAREA